MLAVVRKIVVALVIGGTTYLLIWITEAPLIWTLNFAVFLGGIALVVQVLLDFEVRLIETTDITRSVERTAERLGFQRDSASEQFSLVVKYIEERLPATIRETIEGSQPQGSLIRELAHSLNTPLAQIEATLLVLSVKDPDSTTDLASVLRGVQVCKSFILAFQKISALTDDSQSWEPESIKDILAAGALIYATSSGVNPAVSIDIPDRFEGYSRSYVSAVLLPLVENAMESVQPDGTLTVSTRTTMSSKGTESLVIVDVTNTTAAVPDLTADIFDSYWTTKKNHQGLGLATVKSLLSAYEGTRISFSVSQREVSFSIEFPRRQT